jgi:hypothetical protein
MNSKFNEFQLLLIQIMISIGFYTLNLKLIMSHLRNIYDQYINLC